MKATKTSQGTPLHSAPAVRHVVVGTAGHIDHGKTALVYALTGTDTDRLPEERQRGITIDLGFAGLDLDTPQGQRVHLSLIDVPGHHGFIRNMLAGTGGIDAVMMVIAADEGVKAQTREHLDICTLLGITRGIVVLTKCDVVRAEQLERTRENVRALLRGGFLEDVPLLSVSALTGEGMPELKTALAEVALAAPERTSNAIPRLPIDRAFSVRGFGTVVTGSLQAGSVRAGDTLVQHPAGRIVRVRGVQVHGASYEVAPAPCRVALNLSGVEVGQVARGDTLAPPHTLVSTMVMDAEITLLPGTAPLRHGSRVRVHAFAAETLARVLLFDRKEADTTESTLVRLRLMKPLLVAPGDRFVLRQCSPAMTIGGGEVLDASVPARVRKAKSLEWLNKLRQANSGERLRLRIARRERAGISLSELVAETGHTYEGLRSELGQLSAAGKIAACAGEHWVSVEALALAVTAVHNELAKAASLSTGEIASRCGVGQPVLELAIRKLESAKEIEHFNGKLRLAGRGDEIPAAKRARIQAIEDAYARAGLAAPLLSEVRAQLNVPSTEMRELITFLLRAKRLVRMGGDEAFVHPAALDKLYGDLRRHRGETFDVGRFKTFTGLTRKHAIPLLEHLDQARVTRNNGGTRTVL